MTHQDPYQDPVFKWYNRPIFNVIIYLQLAKVVRNHTLMPKYLKMIKSNYKDVWKET